MIKSFAKNDFIAILESNNIDVDVLTVNAHFAYYKNKGMIDRLQQDVIQLAKQQGYENIWLLGISLGGLGSMLYTNQRPKDINGVILIAPYLGVKELFDEINSYANLEEWLEYVKQNNTGNYKEKLQNIYGCLCCSVNVIRKNPYTYCIVKRTNLNIQMTFWPLV